MLAKYALSDTALAIYGFPQGGMLAMYVGVARPSRCAGIASHSGHFLGADEVLSRPQTLLVVGSLELQADQVMSQAYLLATQALRELDVPFNTQ